MKFEASTLKDIAKALGLSTSTVSRALRDSYDISPQTKKLVMEYAEKINYRPNPIALSLKEKRSRSIGVVVAEIANSFFSQAINGIESVAYKNGYNVIISQSRESSSREAVNLEYLSSRSVDGLLISLSTETNDMATLKQLHQKGLPIVFFDRITEEIKTHKVVVNNFQGAYDATEHLLNNGYKKIAFICNAKHLYITKERLAGYKQALADYDIPLNKKYIRHCYYGGLVFSEVEKAVDKLLALEPRPDAIFASSDKLTTNCLRILNTKKIKVPDDMAIVGFSNSDLTSLLTPSLTVIRQPAFEMGESATDLLIKLIESRRPVTEFDKKLLSPELIIRDSTAARIATI